MSNQSIEFNFFNPDDEVVGRYNFEITCEDGWKTINFTTYGNSEGYAGTQHSKVQLMLNDDESLRVKVTHELQGRYFYFFPHREQRNFEYYFSRAK